MTDDHVKRQENSWILLWRELKKRTVEPFSHVSFVFYFLIAVIVIGGIGFWIELFNYAVYATPNAALADPLSPLRTAVITFFPALAGSACLQLVWAESHQKSLRAFAAFVLFLMVAIAIVIAPNAVTNSSALKWGFASSIIALWTWWIANAYQADLRDDIDPDASLGGNKDAKLSGNLNGFTV